MIGKKGDTSTLLSSQPNQRVSHMKYGMGSRRVFFIKLARDENYLQLRIVIVVARGSKLLDIFCVSPKQRPEYDPLYARIT